MTYICYVKYLLPNYKKFVASEAYWGALHQGPVKDQGPIMWL